MLGTRSRHIEWGGVASCIPGLKLLIEKGFRGERTNKVE